MEEIEHRFSVQVYYEDTDHSGVVYHANYLKYFERARENVLGARWLYELWENQGLGFAVYKADVTYHEGARFSDILEIRSRYTIDGAYRAIWEQSAWKTNANKPAVTALLHLVCINREMKLQKLPQAIAKA